MTTHVMLDLETLSTRVDAALIQIAAVAFDPVTGDIGGRAFSCHIHDGAASGHVDTKTVSWWLRQRHAPAMSAALDGPEAVELVDALLAFYEWFTELGDVEAVWSHGATFDIPILQYALERRGVNVPWSYRAPRDTRTLYMLAPGGMPRIPADEARQHDALYDCEIQVRQVVAALNAFRP